jgi:2,3-dihydroxybenzoate decarboxylase
MRLQKLAVEEHFAEPETVDESQKKFFPPDRWPKLRNDLLDIHGQLLADMDTYGIQMSLLSLVSPGIQEILSKQKAVDTARRSNDYLAEQVAKRPDRFQAFAALPLQDPDAAAQELVRCVKELGFRGAMVNGFSEIDIEESSFYYDLPQYWPFWATVESLDVPFYLHPRRPLKNRKDLEGHPWFLAGAWAFGVETATHALRLMGSGLFDQYPKLTIVLGHLGEMLPNAIWRIENRLNEISRGIPAKKRLGEYLRNNFYFTTSGNCCTKTLMNTILTVGADRVMFGTDSPFEKMGRAADWLDTLDAIGETDRVKIARTNAEKLFKLGALAKSDASA